MYGCIQAITSMKIDEHKKLNVGVLSRMRYQLRKIIVVIKIKARVGEGEGKAPYKMYTYTPIYGCI